MVAPALADGVIVPRGLVPSEDPRWCAASAMVDERFVVKFAWSEEAAERVCYRARVLDALRGAAPAIPLPEVVAASESPAMVVLRRVPGRPFFQVRHQVDPAAAARDLAGVLAALHDPAVLRTVSALLGPLPKRTENVPPGRWWNRLRPWSEWADQVLTIPGRTALVHGDFHGDNHVWRSNRLRLVVDLETVGVGEPEYDLRCLPADCGVEMFLAVVSDYEALTATPVSLDRVMAWHLRTVVGDMAWRTEAGVPLPDGRAPDEWIDDLLSRFAALDISAT